MPQTQAQQPPPPQRPGSPPNANNPPPVQPRKPELFPANATAKKSEHQSELSDDDDDDEESVAPPKAKPQAQSQDVEKGRRSNQDKDPPPPMICCCDCYLAEAVGWIAAVEFIWGLTFLLFCASNLVMYKGADRRIQNNLSPDEYDDKQWKAYGDAHSSALIAALLFHTAELVMSIFLMTASARRTRCLCFLWIACAILILIGEIALCIVDPISITYTTVAINPLRIWFAYIVWCFAAEIVVYPNGPPITVYIQPVAGPTMITSPYSQPVIVPAYGYAYYPYHRGYYGYGYPYGYGYNADAALTGMAVGAGLGLGVGMMADHDHCMGGY